ncbi:hypothetical protein ACHAXT_005415 [Thalassiosira profunda]
MLPPDNRSLGEYASFQYMLARPAEARAVVHQITSFVFFDEPRDEGKKEVDHLVLVRGQSTMVNYYICCLGLLPSHMLGMSRWISAEEYRADDKKSRRKTGDVLRRFRYSFYLDVLEVETLHIFDGCDKDGTERFRLVEYLDCPISPWVAMYAVLPLLALVARCFVRVCGQDVSFPFLVVAAFIGLHLVLRLTGVKVKQKVHR